MIGGLAPGLPLVIAGPPGCGRTVLALQLAAAALEDSDIVAFLSGTQYAIGDLRRVLQAIDEEGVPVWPVSQVWAEFGGGAPGARAADSPSAAPAR